jgi:hypothetical protein
MSQVTLDGANGVVIEVQGQAIPPGCICSYTWASHRPGIVRNGPLASCPADHGEVDL